MYVQNMASSVVANLLWKKIHGCYGANMQKNCFDTGLEFSELGKNNGNTNSYSNFGSLPSPAIFEKQSKTIQYPNGFSYGCNYGLNGYGKVVCGP